MTIQTNRLSRRAFLPLIAGAAASSALLVPKAARAQDAQAWQHYRHDDAGFEVEFPGTPIIWPDVIIKRANENWRRRIETHVEYEKILFGITGLEYRIVPPMDYLVEAYHERAWRLGGRTMTFVTPLALYGVPAAELVSESNSAMAIELVVILKNWLIDVAVHGDKGIDKSRLVQRFFDSFKLLPAN